MTKTSKPSLAETHPTLAAQADGWDTRTYTAGSNKKVGWKCERGHTWRSVIASRSAGSGCPVCSNKTVLAGVNDLATINPELATEADGWDPTTLTAFSNKKVGWKCEYGHTWQSVVANRCNGNGCPVCSGRVALLGVNDLATINPELAREADGWDPTTLSSGSSKKVGWQCKVGHKWRVTVKARSRGSGCPVCSNKTVLAGVNDLATINPELATEADGWDSTTLSSGSGKKVGWQCKIGHKWNATVTDRSSGNGCPVCSGRVALSGVNDLATTNPELAREADGWDPKTLTAHSGKKVGWKCEVGHTWRSNLANRSKGSGCPVCSGRVALLGVNDLATINPELASEADGWDPTTLTAFSNEKVGWKCEVGHIWTATCNSRSTGSGCPVCSHHKVLSGFNDLATTNPELAGEADGWDPTTLTAHSGKKVGWKCEVGHTWRSVLASRSSGTGCPSCASSGFDPNEEGWLYFIDNDRLSMFQIGITNNPDDRLGRHSRKGWDVIELRGPMEGHLTQKLETDSLHALEKRGAILGHKAGIDKFDGYSEAWTKASLTVSSIKQILGWVYEDEGTANKP